MATGVLPFSIPPTPPDFVGCNIAYGSNLVFTDCAAAKNRMPSGTSLVPYSLPLSIQYGGCHISVEAAGPSILVAPWMASPNIVRGWTTYLIQQCVQGGQAVGMGGFMTAGYGALLHYVVNPMTNHLPFGPMPLTTTFMTITVSGPISKLPSPGNTDPALPLLIAQNFENLGQNSRISSSVRHLYGLAAYAWNTAGAGMTRGGSRTWFSQPSGPDEMTYECDANLGNPASVDCTQIEWNQLGPASVSPPSDTVTVGPGIIEFLHSNTCYLAISATVTTILSWDQIRAAVDTLITTCVESPLLAKSGGRAHFGTPPSPSRSRLRKRQAQVSGLNALPPPASIAIFEQKEPWTDPTAEMKSCTWDAVTNQKPVSLCH